jgi:ABC-type branched-subunit amino acid transport system ATPase component/ABC-type branched-subunit amino acid transport system permease subunit
MATRFETLRRPATLALAMLGLATLPFWVGNLYQLHVGALIGAYWILIAGLNLVAGYAGPISVGHVGLLSVGAYAFAILAGTHGVHPAPAIVLAGALGGICGLVLGLPSLRLPGFYFAMSTLAFSLIVGELALAQKDLTGGGVGIAVPGFPAPFDTPRGIYWLILILGSLVTWSTWNVARRVWGRAMIAVRDSEVTAKAVGIPVLRLKLSVFVFSGVTAGVAGAVFGSLQSYITPDTFAFEMGLFFFVCIMVGGRGNIVGPLIGTIVLTALPEIAAPLAKLGNFLYGLLLLVVVLLVPEGFGRLFERLAARTRGQRLASQPVTPDLALLAAALEKGRSGKPAASKLEARGITRRFGGVVALAEVTLDLRPGEIHGLIGPNGSGKTTLLNLLSGYYRPDTGRIVLDDEDLSMAAVQRRPRVGVSRTFQKPRLLPGLTVVDNALIGGWPETRSGFLATALGLPRPAREDRQLRSRARELLRGVGLGGVLDRRANLLEHAEQRFLEIARGLMMRPRFILLDEPAGGLTGPEIEHLGAMIQVMRDAGMGVLLVEHHTDFVFRISDRVTTLDLGKVIKHGRPEEVRSDPEVIRVYLGA